MKSSSAHVFPRCHPPVRRAGSPVRLTPSGLVCCLIFSTAVAAASGGPDLRIGIGVSPITPFLDGQMAGYFYERTADGVHDDLHAKALVIDDGRRKIALVACDLVRLPKAAAADARQRITKRLGIPGDHVLISATHSHTGPAPEGEYVTSLSRRIADSVVTAAGRTRAARLLVAVGNEPSLPHNRRYLMKDGRTVTNPGFLNADIVQSRGPIDPRVPVIVAEDERGQAIMTWVNYAMHLDTVGSTWISADFPFFMGRQLAKVKGLEMETIFTIGAAGDINHWDVRRPGPQRGLAEAQRIGEVLAAAVLKAFTHLEPVATSRVRARSAALDVPAPKVTEEEITAARRVIAAPARRDVDFTLERVQAVRTLALAPLGGTLRTEIQVLAAGPIAFVGIPGELFVELGMAIQKASPFPHTFIVEQANDTIGYIPTEVAFQQGGYETTSARILPGGGELIVRRAVELLKQVYEAE